ncbi:hypothetical protein [Thermogladius calderae]|uniref:hypothetical protein n=1 Tax=Thermogladius calderae TaxID=1200300 RepID=UPI00064E3FAC|nr:hypothetical protein [Thermogladius calderae]
MEKARDIVDWLAGLAATSLWFYITLQIIEVDRQLVKREELEADEIAIRLAGCKGVFIFARMLKQFEREGYTISHESILGFPALTIDERIRFIYEKCQPG